MNELLAKGNVVVYGSAGVCKVEGVESRSFGNAEEKYIVLKQLYPTGNTIFIPNENSALKAQIRDVMSKDELDELLCALKDTKCEQWIEDKRSRDVHFREVFSGGVKKELFMMIRCLLNRSAELQKKNKQLSGTDITMLKKATMLIESEVAFSLNIPQSDVVSYITNAIEA